MEVVSVGREIKSVFKKKRKLIKTKTSPRRSSETYIVVQLVFCDL